MKKGYRNMYKVYDARVISSFYAYNSSENDIMQELHLQDKMLSEQTNIYLKNIIRQNEEILKKLDET